ncbi:helix-turn-helix domain-containing protein [Streptomyces tauricus]|uniref:helix-turn-helix domain-containing protein n=1 Tax=Streptomyces tauricus TaxID=68274 RepID=UPI0022447FA0|nr:helix-turn-helix transcriptional regulator [Streptomyces tauricus]MCW8103008.1 helix-turn-helix domain-containing protein [Streptomyces tauricus]
MARRGRRQQELAPRFFYVGAVWDLAVYLRGVRERGGLTYAQMAARGNWSQAAFKRATAGRTLAHLSLVRDFLTVCGADPCGADELWILADDDRKRAARDAKCSSVKPRPEFVRDAADLSGALRDAYRYAARPALRTMEAGAGAGRLPRSTAHSIVNGRALPTDLMQYLAFLEACDIEVEELGPWFGAWHKAFLEPGAETLIEEVFPRRKRPGSDYDEQAQRAYLQWVRAEQPLRRALGQPLRRRSTSERWPKAA